MIFIHSPVFKICKTCLAAQECMYLPHSSIILLSVVPSIPRHSVLSPAGGDPRQDSPWTDGCTEGHGHPALEAQSVRAHRNQPGPDYIHMEDVRQEVRLLTLSSSYMLVSAAHRYWRQIACQHRASFSPLLTHLKPPICNSSMARSVVTLSQALFSLGFVASLLIFASDICCLMFLCLAEHELHMCCEAPKLVHICITSKHLHC